MFRPVLPLNSSRKRRVRTGLVAAAAGLAFAATAHAAVVSFSTTDPKGDNKGTAGHDFVALSGTYDASTGSMSVTVETAAALGQGVVSMSIGTATNGVCAYSNPDETNQLPFMQFYLLNIGDSPWAPQYNYATKGDLTGPAEMKKSGNAITFSSPANAELVNLPLDCVYAVIARDTPEGGEIADDAAALASVAGTTPDATTPGATTPGADALKPPIKVTTTEPDADRDGNPDSADVCPQAPGALANGCPSVMPASELRLGAKRVVVDRLVARVAAECPAKVTIVVTSKGKTIGKGTFTVDQYGAFCRVQGVVRLKVRRAKVRVVAKATGMGGTAKSIKR